jgi:hypothetical protein
LVVDRASRSKKLPISRSAPTIREIFAGYYDPKEPTSPQGDQPDQQAVAITIIRLHA